MAEIDDKELEQLRAAAARVAELEGDAVIGKAHRESESKRIDAAMRTLPFDQRELLAAQTTLDGKAKLLAYFTKPPPPNPPPPDGSPAPPVSFDSAWGTAEWERVKARDPEGAKRWLESKAPKRGKPIFG